MTQSMCLIDVNQPFGLRLVLSALSPKGCHTLCRGRRPRLWMCMNRSGLKGPYTVGVLQGLMPYSCVSVLRAWGFYWFPYRWFTPPAEDVSALRA